MKQELTEAEKQALHRIECATPADFVLAWASAGLPCALFMILGVINDSDLVFVSGAFAFLIFVWWAVSNDIEHHRHLKSAIKKLRHKGGAPTMHLEPISGSQ